MNKSVYDSPDSTAISKRHISHISRLSTGIILSDIFLNIYGKYKGTYRKSYDRIGGRTFVIYSSYVAQHSKWSALVVAS